MKLLRTAPALKNERVHGARGETRGAAGADVFGYIDVFCNRLRRRLSLDGVSPMRFYRTWLQQQSVP
ncbi:MAG: IS3 family transposase [Casimicrobiaceae bacterium]